MTQERYQPPDMLRLCILYLLLLPGLATAATVQGVRLWAGPDNTRVVLDMNAAVEHTVFTLSGPDRIVIDIQNTQFHAADLPAADGVVTGIRHAARHGDDLRIVLDLTQSAQPKTFLLPPHEQYGYRLVIDLENAARRVPTPIQQMPSGARDLIIAIDAGHGGEDPGAVGRHGTREKTVALAIARRLAKLVDATPGMQAVLVREGDYYISLRGRMEIARKQRADMFISIHADAFRDKRAHGASVYVLSERGASSEAARWLAESENASDLVGGVKLDDKSNLLASVLLDLSQTATISASLKAASRVLEKIDGVARLHKSAVQQAAFIVLKSPDIPSMLVETAFISNPDEEHKLRDNHYQEKLARAVLNGVHAYFTTNPLPGTLLAQHVNHATEHTITRGETLSGIAQRYRVSVDTLRTVNGLDGDFLKVGAVLRIPATTQT